MRALVRRQRDKRQTRPFSHKSVVDAPVARGHPSPPFGHPFNGVELGGLSPNPCSRPLGARVRRQKQGLNRCLTHPFPAGTRAPRSSTRLTGLNWGAVA
jgi:hypothetical protein